METKTSSFPNRCSRLHHFLFALFALVMSLLYTSCGGNKTGNNVELKRAVKEVARECPFQLSDYMSIENVEYSYNTLTITYSTAAGMMNFDALRENYAAYRNNILLGFANQKNVSFKKIIDAVIRAKADMKLVFIDVKDDRFELFITAEELQSYRPGNHDADPEVLLKTMLDNLRLQIPIDMGNGLVIKDVLLDENRCIYIYDCDESVIDIDRLNANIPEIKRYIIENFSDNNAAQELSRVIKATNRNLDYKYVGASSGKTVVVSIGPEELP